MRRRRWAASIAQVAALGACQALTGVDDLQFVDPTDASASGAKSGGGGTGGGVGGGWGGAKGGASGTGGGVDAAPDQQAGTGGVPQIDATSEPAPVTCASEGIWIVPEAPIAGASFEVNYKDPNPWACIDFEVTCSSTTGETVTGFDTPACTPDYCWSATVTGCNQGPAKIEFFRHKATDATCSQVYDGGPGVVEASCTVQVGPAQL